VFGHTDNNVGYGVMGRNNSNNSYGYLGGPTNTGAYGQTADKFAGGVKGRSTDASGVGVVGLGNNLNSGAQIVQGAGMGAYGMMYGIDGRAEQTTGNRAGGLFSCNGGPSVFVGAIWDGGTQYKIRGTGNVSTIMSTRQGEKILFAPECPEPLFEDFGQGKLVNGHIRVELDPIFLDCIKTDEKHPLKVFIQLNDDCNGVYVKVAATGFDVYELKNGLSNASFTYRVIGNRKDTDFLRLPQVTEKIQRVESN
jgi:hypothetical protein